MKHDKTITYNCPTCEENFVYVGVLITEMIRYPDRFYWNCKYCGDSGFTARKPLKNKTNIRRRPNNVRRY